MAQPIEVRLGDGAQPTSPLHVTFPVSKDKLLATTGLDEASTVLLALRSAGGSIDLLPAHWDPATATVGADVPHLSQMWPIQIDVGGILDQVRDAFLQSLELRSPKPDCVGKRARIGDDSYEVSSPDEAWICLVSRDGQLRADISSNSGIGWRVTSTPKGQIEMSSDLNLSSALLTALLQNMHRHGAGVVFPGARTAITFDDPGGGSTLHFRQHDLVALLRILGGVLDTALGGLGDLRWVDLLAKGDCLQNVIEAGRALEAGRAADIVSGVVRGFFACAGAIEKMPGPQRVVLAIFATAPGLVATFQMQLLNLIRGRTEFDVAIARRGSGGGGGGGGGGGWGPAGAPCSPQVLAKDVGVQRADIKVDYCKDGWAVVSHPTAPGDTTRILRRTAGNWKLVTFLPSTMCQDEMRTLGAPAHVVTMTPPCEKEVERFTTISPGRLGALHVGMKATQAEAAGLVERPDEDVCGVEWEPTEAVKKQGIDLEFRGRSDDDLDSIDVWQEDGEPQPTIRTAEGVGIGTSAVRIKRLYGVEAELRTFEGEGGEYSAYVIFGDDGALMLNLGSTSNGQGDRVVAMHAVRGTSFDDLEAFVGGC